MSTATPAAAEKKNSLIILNLETYLNNWTEVEEWAKKCCQLVFCLIKS